MFLLDTNAVSELMKPRPQSTFLRWYEGADEAGFHYSILTVAELRRGSLRLEEGPKRRALETFIRDLLVQRDDRVLVVGAEVAEAWTHVAVRHAQARVTVGGFDELIAATAIAHDLTVVTRNVRDFQHSGCRLLSPWND